MYPESVANFLPEGMFDHCPCLINFEVQMVRRTAAFKYFNMWALAKNFEEVVRTVWSKEVNGTPMFRVVTRLKKLKGELKKLNKEQFSDIENLTNVAELALKEAQTKLIMDPLNEEMCQAERLCATEFEELQKARNMYLRQKAKEAWVANGDENTAFFHSSIRKRRSQNRVYQIKDMHHNVCNSNVAIQAAFEEFYKSLLGDSKGVCPVNKVIVRKGKCLTVDHMEILLAPLSDNEIKDAMFDISWNKAPGPDGYSSQFFKDTWHIVRTDVCRAVRDVYTKGRMLKQCNNTILTLIPKVAIPDIVQ
ncbi:uncharacterized protein LOC141614238 [Silene latifolia]|uniref:uncharacterized protein LOC141614238 n=1 Tax=Silene latifolia TaxID=37657 RepID=UPI003D786A06